MINDVILGATSGDTGSAALRAAVTCERVEISISSLPKSFGCPEKVNDHRSGKNVLI